MAKGIDVSETAATSATGDVRRDARERRARVQQRIGFTAWGALAALQIVWHAWWLPPENLRWLAVAIGLIPLAIPLLHWRRPERALLIAGMFSLLYFCHGVVMAWAEPATRVAAWIEIVLAIVIILATVRMPQRRAR